MCLINTVTLLALALPACLNTVGQSNRLDAPIPIHAQDIATPARVDTRLMLDDVQGNGQRYHF